MKTVFPPLLAAAILLTGGSSVVSQQTESGPPVQVAKKFQIEKAQPLTVDYLLYLPKGYGGEGNSKWPLILFLHGAGERGENVWKVATHGPPRNVAVQPDFPFIVVSPLCPAGQTWSRDVLLALLDHIAGSYAVDLKRVYLTGLSMGGYGTWDLGTSFPEKFAAIAPICGGGSLINVKLGSRDKSAALKSLPIWAFHGAKDAVVPLSESERMVEAAKTVGVKEVKLTVYPEAEHDAWTETYKNPDLYAWFLKHSR